MAEAEEVFALLLDGGLQPMEWKDDAELFSLMKKELFTAVLGDVMDKLSFQRQFLPPEIKPLQAETVLVGRAMPVLEEDLAAEPDKPFGLMLEALDDLAADEVYVASGGSLNHALWGELMSTRAMALGAAGVVLDGFTRDTREILQLGFPVFCRGSYAQDVSFRGRIAAFRVEIRIGQATIRPGDILFGDIDGVLVIPHEIEAETVTRALEKVRGEKLVRKALQEGMSAVEAFRKYGVM
jgi:regulator of RNase E activity RraA